MAKKELEEQQLRDIADSLKAWVFLGKASQDTFESVAKRINLPETSLSNICSGKGYVPFDDANRFVKALGYSTPRAFIEKTSADRNHYRVQQRTDIVDSLTAQVFFGKTSEELLDNLAGRLRLAEKVYKSIRTGKGKVPVNTLDRYIAGLGYSDIEAFITAAAEDRKRYAEEKPKIKDGYVLIGECLRALDMHNKMPNLSRQELAERAGCHSSYVSIVMNGGGSVSPTVYMTVMRACGFDSLLTLWEKASPYLEPLRAHERAVGQLKEMVEKMDAEAGAAPTEPFYPRFCEYVRRLHGNGMTMVQEADRINVPAYVPHYQLRRIECDGPEEPKVGAGTLWQVMKYYGKADTPEEAWSNMEAAALALPPQPVSKAAGRGTYDRDTHPGTKGPRKKHDIPLTDPDSDVAVDDIGKNKPKKGRYD